MSENIERLHISVAGPGVQEIALPEANMSMYLYPGGINTMTVHESVGLSVPQAGEISIGKALNADLGKKESVLKGIRFDITEGLLRAATTIRITPETTEAEKIAIRQEMRGLAKQYLRAKEAAKEPEARWNTLLAQIKNREVDAGEVYEEMHHLRGIINEKNALFKQLGGSDPERFRQEYVKEMRELAVLGLTGIAIENDTLVAEHAVRVPYTLTRQGDLTSERDIHPIATTALVKISSDQGEYFVLHIRSNNNGTYKETIGPNGGMVKYGTPVAEARVRGTRDINIGEVIMGDAAWEAREEAGIDASFRNIGIAIEDTTVPHIENLSYAEVEDTTPEGVIQSVTALLTTLQGTNSTDFAESNLVFIPATTDAIEKLLTMPIPMARTHMATMIAVYYDMLLAKPNMSSTEAMERTRMLAKRANTTWANINENIRRYNRSREFTGRRDRYDETLSFADQGLEDPEKLLHATFSENEIIVRKITASN